VHLADLDYELPAELIAQQPTPARRASRLLVVCAGAAAPGDDGTFGELLLEQLEDTDLVVANDSRVLHARIAVQRPGGGVGELLLLEPAGSGADAVSRQWRALARPARRLRPGMRLRPVRRDAAANEITALEREADGTWIVELPVVHQAAADWLEEVGELPLPPYIAPDGQPGERYQTVYATEPGSVAAPTAGLHFDQPLWEQIGRSHETARVTLHVGAGTFLPVRAERLADHAMHAERYVVPPAADRAVRDALAAGRRVVSVGTTTARVLESVYGPSALPTTGSTELFMTPGYRFGCVGALLTNFHLPRSTLLALVMAFAGADTTRAAYAAAVERRMRFYSFGDAMFVHGHAVDRTGAL